MKPIILCSYSLSFFVGPNSIFEKVPLMHQHSAMPSWVCFGKRMQPPLACDLQGKSVLQHGIARPLPQSLWKGRVSSGGIDLEDSPLWYKTAVEQAGSRE